MTTVSDALPLLDSARALLDDIGLRPYTVSVRVVTWSGSGPGDGTSSTVDTPVTVANGRRPKVTVVVDKDVLPSGGTLASTRYLIDNVTPLYSGGGFDPSTLDPTGSEVFFVLQGPGLPPSGMLCKKLSEKFDSPFRYSVVVESIGQAA